MTRTRPAPNRAYLGAWPVRLPARLRPVEKPYKTTPLSDIVTEWSQQPISNLAMWCRRKCVYAQIGLLDGMSYPVFPPGAFIQIDPEAVNVNGTFDSNYYFVRHPYGYSCCRCVIDKRTIFLLPSSRLYPQLEFPHPGVVHVVGRVRGFCANIDSITPPPSTTLKRLRSRRASMRHTPAALAEISVPGPELLLNQRLCLGIPYHELSDATVTLHGIGADFGQYHVTNGHAHKIEHTAQFVPTIHTLYALAAYYALDYADLLHAYGVWSGEEMVRNTSEAAKDEASKGGSYSDPLQDEFVAFILDQWLEWPALLSQLLPDFSRLKIFFFGGNSGIDPILKPASFLLVDESRQASRQKEAVGAGDWEKPIYLLYTREGFIVQYAEQDGREIVLLPHHRAADQRQRVLLSPTEAEIVGRVVAVASLL